MAAPEDKVLSDLYPALFYRDASAAMDWLNRAFGFVARFVVPGDGGTIVHAEMSYGSAVIMLGTAKPEQGWVSPLDLPAVNQVNSIYVNDPDAHHAQARAAGAVITRELTTEEYGARGYAAKDIEGHHWYFGDYRPGEYWET